MRRRVTRKCGSRRASTPSLTIDRPCTFSGPASGLQWTVITTLCHRTVPPGPVEGTVLRVLAVHEHEDVADALLPAHTPEVAHCALEGRLREDEVVEEQ